MSLDEVVLSCTLSKLYVIYVKPLSLLTVSRKANNLITAIGVNYDPGMNQCTIPVIKKSP